MDSKEQTSLWLNKKFNELYERNEDPWGCNSGIHSFDNILFFMLIEQHKKEYNNILDIGCGLGGLTNELNYLCNSHGMMVGVDVSKIAAETASAKYPFIEFFEWDILKDEVQENMKAQFDLITMSEVLWYVCEQFEMVMKKIQSLLAPKGIFAMHQYFPFDQKYYKEYICGIRSFHRKMEEMGWINNKKLVSYNEQGQVVLALYQVNEEDKKCQTL